MHRSSLTIPDFGKTVKNRKLNQTSCLNKPPTVIMTGVSKLRALHRRKGNSIREHVNTMLESNPEMQEDFSYGTPKMIN